MVQAFINAQIFDGNEIIRGKVLLTEGEKIIGIVDNENIPVNADVLDCENGILSAGFIDLQIYGGGGSLFSNDLTAESLNKIADALVKSGTTSFFITLATNSFDVFKKAIDIVKHNPHRAVRGIHLEGPFINPVKKGAHLEQYIKIPDVEEVEELLGNAGGVVKMMTLAPEQCNKTVIEFLKKSGVLVSAGHSNATYAEAQSGFDWGITAITHFYNAMSSFHHRDTGLPGATFLNNSVHASIICDGIHVDYEAVKIAKEILKERLFLITDAVEEVSAGDYVHVRKSDRFTLPDGTLSGSALTMTQAVKNCIENVGMPLEEALKMATIYPAKIATFENVGYIKNGYKANLVCLSESLGLKFSVLEGTVYK